MSAKSIIAFSTLLITLLVASVAVTSASTLDLTVTPGKQVYNVGETVSIDGSLTLDGSPVSDAIVAVQVDDSKDNAFIIQTLDTGPVDPAQWSIEILELIPCDSGGEPQGSFQPGGNAGFKITVKNKASSPCDIIIVLSIVYSNKAPYKVLTMYNGSISGGQTKTVTTWPVPISLIAVTGNTTVYASIFNVLPKDGGFAQCPGDSASFLIGSGGQGQSPSGAEFPLEIGLSQIYLWLGNYTVYGTVRYETWHIDYSTSTFEVILVGDLHPDGKIDMKDIAIVARAFGSYPGHPLWNPIADITGQEPLVPDGKVDMRDVALVAQAFGTIVYYD